MPQIYADDRRSEENCQKPGLAKIAEIEKAKSLTTKDIIRLHWQAQVAQGRLRNTEERQNPFCRRFTQMTADQKKTAKMPGLAKITEIEKAKSLTTKDTHSTSFASSGRSGQAKEHGGKAKPYHG